jgi:arginyl-tRNA synthetase
MIKTEQELVTQGLLKENNGSWIVDLEDVGLTNAVVRNHLGASLYLTRDITAAKNRWERFHFDQMIYVVGSDQNLHFKQLFAILTKMGCDWVEKCKHISFGTITLPGNIKMSSRKGQVLPLETILNQAQKVVYDKMLKNTQGKLVEIENPEILSDIIGISSVVAQDFSSKRNVSYEFHPKLVTSFEGDTGAYLQYTHARLCSMRDKNINVPLTTEVDYSLLSEPSACNLVKYLSRWPDVVRQTSQSLEPCAITAYLFKLTHTISTAHKSLRVKDQPLGLQRARMLLFESSRTVLANGLQMLGVAPVQRM